MTTSPDGLAFYLVTDNNGFGQTIDPSGAHVSTFTNPGSILEFKYVKPRP
jgi:hypothetical protein